MGVATRWKVTCPTCGWWHWWATSTKGSLFDRPLRLAVGYVTCAGRRGFPMVAYSFAEQLAPGANDSRARDAARAILIRLRARLREALAAVDALLALEDGSWNARARGRLVAGGAGPVWSASVGTADDGLALRARGSLR